MKPQTRLVHAGDRRKLGRYTPVSTPIFASSSFFYDTTEELADVFSDGSEGHTYARMGSATTDGLEDLVASLEGGHCCFATASGMGAVHLAIMAGLIDRRQAIVAANVLYGGTLELLRSVLPRSGIEVRYCDFCDLEALERAVAEVRPAVLVTETLSNPCLRVADLDRVRQIATEHGALMLVDNTFTPLLIRPFDHGADMVIHSATKYLAGHGDVLAGAVVAPPEHEETLRHTHHCLGGTVGPFEAFLVMRGIKTLALRMRQHCSNARKVFEALGDHPAVERLVYPGDPLHPDAATVAALMPEGQSGGAIGIDVRGGIPGAYRFLDRLRLVKTSASIGDLTTLGLHPATATHRTLSQEEREAIGVTDGLVRLSVGGEHIDDILADLRQALGPQ